MTVKGRIIRIEEYRRQKRKFDEYNVTMSSCIEINQCLERGDEEGLKKYPPWLIKEAREVIAEKRAKEVKLVRR